ncbi:MAG: hypothetical protein AB1689_15755 [Thermodesulfobacteriota bacterium]
MAKKGRPRPARPARDHERQLRRLVILDRLRGAAVPLLAIGVAVAAWPLAVAGLLDVTLGVTIAGAAVMVAALHAGLSEFADERTTAATAATLLAFAALWWFVVFGSFRDEIDPGAELFAARLSLAGRAVTAPLHGIPGDYRVVVEGELDASGAHASRSAHYRVALTEDGGGGQALEGDFSDRWSTRRSGRRGVASVHVARTADKHIVHAGGGDLHLALESLGPGAHDAVSVRLYPERFSTTLLVGLATALTAAAMVIDSWRAVDPGELLLTSITLGAVFAVASLRRFAPPHPGFGDLAFNGAIGAIAGTGAGRALVHALRRVRALAGRP